MPQLPLITYPDGTRLYVWRLTETLGQLLSLAPASPGAGAAKRQMERAAELLLTAKAFGPEAELRHTAHGAPYIAGPGGSPLCPAGHVSLSHTRGAVCMAVNTRLRVGVDVERVAARVARVREKFLTDDELARIPAADSVANTMAWTAKEAVYKAALDPSLTLREGVSIDTPPASGGQYMASCHGAAGQARMTLTTTMAGDLVTTIAISLPPAAP